VAEGSLPAAERSSGEELAVVVGNLGPDLRTLDATAITANEGRNGLARRTIVVERTMVVDLGYARRSTTLRRGGSRDFSHATC